MSYCIFTDLLNHDVTNKTDVIGKLHDIYLDESTWTMTWLVVETGHWFSSDKVLVDARQIVKYSPETLCVEVAISKRDIEKLPSASEHPPVSDQSKPEFSYFAGSDATGMIPGFAGMMMPSTIVERPEPLSNAEQELQLAAERQADRHLRSAREVEGYAVAATDGTLGPVSDFVFDQNTGTIALIALDTSKWLPDRTVVIVPDAIDRITWEQREIIVNMDKDTIKQSPELQDLKSIQTSYISRLAEYYHLPVY